jgi:hypothetical protein
VNPWSVIKLGEKIDAPTSLPMRSWEAETISASTKRPNIISKNPHAEDPSMKGEDKLISTSDISDVKEVFSKDILDDGELALSEVRDNTVLRRPALKTGIEEREAKTKRCLMSGTEDLL